MRIHYNRETNEGNAELPPIGTGEQDECLAANVTTPGLEQDEAVNRWLAAIRHDMAKRRRFDRLMLASGIVNIAFYLPSLVLRSVFGVSLPYVDLAATIPAMAILVLTLLQIPRNARAARNISQQDDTGLVGAMVDIWNPQADLKYDSRTRMAAQEALIRLLPKLAENDGCLLKESQRAMLRTVLTFGYREGGNQFSPELQIAVIRAFHRIGDWKSVPGIQNLTVTIWSEEVREVARECLPRLKELAEKMQVGQTLLRASDAPKPAPDTLLRAAQAVYPEGKPEELLRPK